MINDLLHIMYNLQSAFFILIPILLGFALFSKNIFKYDNGFYFLLTAGIITLTVRIILVFTVNKLVGRYYLPVVIIWTCFAAAGAYSMALLIQYVVRKLKLKVNFKIILAVVMTLLLLGSAVKSFKVVKKEFLNEFAECLRPFDSENTVLISMTGSGERINQKLSGKIKIKRASHAKRSFYYWLDFFSKFEKNIFKHKNLFIVARQRKKLKYASDSFENIFRSYYMIFPFELVKKCNYRKDTYLLYRFNYKIRGTRLSKKHPLELKAQFQPQLNIPKNIFVLPEGARVFFSGFNAFPDTSRYKSKFEYNGKSSSSGFMDISGSGGELKLTVKDKLLNTQSEAKSSIKIVSLPKNISVPLRILLIESETPLFQKSEALLKKTLKKYGVKTEIISLHDFISSKEYFGYWNVLKKINVIKDGIKRHPKLFSSAFDIVLINCGYGDIYSSSVRWRINTEAEKMKQQLNIFINTIKEKFPEASIGIALPIAPAPAPVRYKIGNSHQKQGHCALSKSLYECLGDREDENVYILPLFHNIDPQKDYHITPEKLQEKGIKYWYSMALSKAGQQKSANSLAAWIMYIKNKKDVERSDFK